MNLCTSKLLANGNGVDLIGANLCASAAAEFDTGAVGSLEPEAAL